MVGGMALLAALPWPCLPYPPIPLSWESDDTAIWYLCVVMTLWQPSGAQSKRPTISQQHGCDRAAALLSCSPLTLLHSAPLRNLSFSFSLILVPLVLPLLDSHAAASYTSPTPALAQDSLSINPVDQPHSAVAHDFITTAGGAFLFADVSLRCSMSCTIPDPLPWHSTAGLSATEHLTVTQYHGRDPPQSENTDALFQSCSLCFGSAPLAPRLRLFARLVSNVSFRTMFDSCKTLFVSSKFSRLSLTLPSCQCALSSGNARGSACMRLMFFGS